MHWLPLRQATFKEALVLARRSECKPLEQTILTNLVNSGGKENVDHTASLQTLLRGLGRTTESSCAICLERLPGAAPAGEDEGPPRAVVALECGHVYCKACVERLPTARCPQCMLPTLAIDM